MKKFTNSVLFATALVGAQFALAQTEEVIEDVETTEAAAESGAVTSDSEIRVIKSASTTVTEYHAQGRTYKLEVDPANTPAYILSDQDGNGRLNNSDTSIDSDVLVPEWTLGSW